MDAIDANKHIERLNKIISTQSLLAEAEFDFEGFMHLAVQQMQQITPATGAVIELVDGEFMVYRAVIGTVETFKGLRIPTSTSISGLCLKERKVLCSEDTERDSRVNKEACRLISARSLVVAPLCHEGDTVGVLKIISKDPSTFDDLDVRTLQLMAGLIASALSHQKFYEKTENLLIERTKAYEELKIAEEKVEHMALHDQLTTLPNRNLFIERIKQAIALAERTQKSIGLMYLDIDYFKTVNDTLGHAAGDALLKAFAGRLLQCVRASDTVARFGGDEFVLILDFLNNKEDAIKVAEKIIEKIQEPFHLAEQNVNISTSIGLTFSDPNKKATGDILLAEADKALYKAKKAGRNRYVVFKPDAF